MIVANIGGSDGVLSLYANIAHLKGKKPTMIAVDKKHSNLSNFLFRYYVAQIAGGSREAYVRRLFNYKDDEKTKAKADFSSAKAMRKTLLDVDKYDSKNHEENLMKEFAEDRGLAEFVEGPVYSTTRYLGKGKNYELFVNGVADNIEKNPKTHYLNDDELYREVFNSITRGKEPKYRVQAMHQDLSTQEGLDKLRTVLQKYGLDREESVPIDVAFIPGLKSGFDGFIPFLRDNVEYVISRR